MLGLVRVDFVLVVVLLELFSSLEGEGSSVKIPEEADVAVIRVVSVDVWLTVDVLLTVMCVSSPHHSGAISDKAWSCNLSCLVVSCTSSLCNSTR